MKPIRGSVASDRVEGGQTLRRTPTLHRRSRPSCRPLFHLLLLPHPSVPQRRTIRMVTKLVRICLQAVMNPVQFVTKYVRAMTNRARRVPQQVRIVTKLVRIPLRAVTNPVRIVTIPVQMVTNPVRTVTNPVQAACRSQSPSRAQSRARADGARTRAATPSSLSASTAADQPPYRHSPYLPQHSAVS